LAAVVIYNKIDVCTRVIERNLDVTRALGDTDDVDETARRYIEVSAT
jgi:hypothetical protein